MKIDIQKLREKTDEGKKLADMEAEKARIAEEQRRQKKAQEDEEYFKKNLAFHFKEIEKNIDKIAEKGERSHVFQIDNDRRLIYELKSLFEASGFTCHTREHWYAADNGDPDSGEGAHDSGTIYWLTISW